MELIRVQQLKVCVGENEECTSRLVSAVGKF